MVKINNIDEEKIKKSTTDELKKYIMDVNRSQIINSLYMALLESDRYKDILNENYSKNSHILSNSPNEEKKIKEIFNKVIAKELDLDFLLNSKELDSELKVDYFRNLRRETHGILMSISGYITEIAYINEIANEILKRHDFKSKYSSLVEKVDLNKFYENIYSFLMTDLNTLPIRAMEIVSVLPLRISKNKYFDILKNAIVKGLKNSSKTRVDLILNRYKAIFNGTLELDYGQKFDYYFRKTHEFKTFNLKDATISDIKNFYNDTSEILHEMNVIVNIIREIGMVINRFLVINMIKSNISRELTKDEYDLLSDFRNDNEKSLEKIKESFSKGNDTLQSLISEIFNRDEKIDDDLNDELLKTQEILAYLNDNYLEREELLFEGKNTSVDDDYLEQSVDNFIQFLSRNIAEMDNKQRKIRMRRLLCITDFPFENPEEFFNYLKSSLEVNANKEDMIASINLAAEVMARYVKGE